MSIIFTDSQAGFGDGVSMENRVRIDGRQERQGGNLTLSVLETLGHAIVTGRFDGRQFPIEADLAKAHGVSRSVIREAVKMLTTKGLLSARPRHGTIVEPSASWNLFDPDILRWSLERKFSVDLLRQFNQLRVGIEPEAAALAAQVHDDASLKAIRSGLDAMRGPGDALEADIAFHIAVLRATGNPFYVQLRTVVATALRVSIHFTNRIKGHTASIEDHAAVADAIAAGDPDAARIAMRRIIGDVLLLIADK